MKTCGKCKQEKPIEEFHWKDKTKHTRQSYCKICSALKGKAHYNANKQTYIDSANKRAISIRQELNERKSNIGCSVCGESEGVCLDFHHLEDKLQSVSILAANASRKRLEDEIKKCVVLCSNCHRKHHAGIIELPSIA